MDPPGETASERHEPRSISCAFVASARLRISPYAFADGRTRGGCVSPTYRQEPLQGNRLCFGRASQFGRSPPVERFLGAPTPMTVAHPFAAFRSEVVNQTPLRAAITAAYRRPETECVPPLLDLAALTPEEDKRVAAL